MRAMAIGERYRTAMVPRAVGAPGAGASREAQDHRPRRLEDPGAGRLIFSVESPYSPGGEGRTLLDTGPVSPVDPERTAHGNRKKIARGNAGGLLGGASCCRKQRREIARRETARRPPRRFAVTPAADLRRAPADRGVPG